MAHLAPWQPLYPSQRSGALRLESALWQGNPQEFQLQWHEDRVYFRTRGDSSTAWATLESCAETDALICFHEAVASGRYGVCFLNGTRVRYGKEAFFFSIQFIYAPDGTGLLREWSSRDWITFAPKETSVWVCFPELTLPQKNDGGPSRNCCYYAAQSVRDDLLFRTISDEETERLSWKSPTNKAEFLRVMGWLWSARILVPDAGAKKWTDVSLTTTSWYMHSRFHLGRTHWHADLNLKGWLENYFTGEGFDWHQTDWGKRRFRKLRAREPHLQVFWEPRGINWRFPFILCTIPSFHERLEAYLELRNWLRGKVPISEIEAWLSHPPTS